ncbi:MAG: PAS domain S-box protein, partial [Spirochaetia bacterium]|nr:PAS domain S-box protein [Spirochaetia bacterium]
EAESLFNPLNKPLELIIKVIKDNKGKAAAFLTIAKDLTKEKENEEKLKTLDKLNKLVIESSNIGIWERDLINDTVYFSPQWKELIGYKDNEIKNNYNEWVNRIHPDDMHNITNTITRHLSGKLPFYKTEYRLRHKDGTYKWVLSQGIASRNKDGKLSRFTGSHTDITDIKEKEEKLISINNILTTLSMTSEALVHLDNENELIEEICRILVDTGGYKLAFIGFVKKDRIKSIDIKASYGETKYLDNIKIRWSNTKLGNGPVGESIKKGKLQIINNLDETKSFQPWRKLALKHNLKSSIALPIKFGKETMGVLGVYSEKLDCFQDKDVFLLEKLSDDLSYKLGFLINEKEKTRAAIKLKKQETQLRSIINNSPALISIRDIKGNIILANNNFRVIDDTFPENILGKNIRDLFTPELAEKIFKNDKLIFKKKKPIQTEERIFHKDGSRHTYLTVKFPVYLEKKTPYGTCAISTDITERIESEKKIKDSLYEKDILLQEIHHRVKNNLQVISSLLQLQSYYSENAGVKTILAESQSRIRAMSLAHEILYKSPNLSKINFKEYIEKLIKTLFNIQKPKKQNIRLKLNIQEDKYRIDASIYCGLIINELITNSLKYAFSELQSGEIGVVFHKKKNKECLLEVYDNGKGVKNKDILKNSKSLGLKLVHMLVEGQLKGKMNIINKKGLRYKIQYKEALDEQ